jgi:hypothetical protein
MKPLRLATSVAVLALSLLLTTADTARAAIPGIRGTITSIGSNFFVMSLKAKPSGDGTKVFCDANTKFMHDGSPCSPSEIKEGETIAVAGSTIGPYQLRAVQVTILTVPATTQPASKK